MRRVMLVFIGGAALVTALIPAATVAPIAARPNDPTTKPNGAIIASIDWASRNWSGYADTGDPAYTDVTGDWTVPAVTDCSAKGRSPSCYSAAWVGIDGFNNRSLIQTGTNQNYINGSASYEAWWTTPEFGLAEQVITTGCSPSTNCGTVAAGDSISAQITNTSGTSWNIIISSSQGWTFTQTVTYSGPGDSAEWIMEAPRIFPGSTATMPTYSTFDFHPVSANSVAPLADALGGELIQKGKVVSIPSEIDSDFDGFAMAYGSTQPSAPNP